MKQFAHSFDVVVIGDGPIGLSSALGLAQFNLSVAVIKANSVPLISPLCHYSLSDATQRMLARLGVWPRLRTDQINPFHSMHIWDHSGAGNMRFHHEQMGQQQIGHVLDALMLREALHEAVLASEMITLIEGCANNIGFGEREAWLTLDDLSHLSARLVVAADGSESWVRNQCRIPMSFWDQERMTLMATVRTEIPHGNCARQAFLEHGPLAFLPLSDPNLCAVSWTLTHQEALQLQLADTNVFNQKLMLAFDGRLGLCELESMRDLVPLKMRYARHFARHRLVLIGEAAHTVHPLIGQGINIGLMDSAALTQEVGRITAMSKDIGLLPLLREYERWRKADAAKMVGVMEVFNQFYHGSNPLKKIARDVGMNFMGNVPHMKEKFLLHAMGNPGDLPDLCQIFSK
jgi:2-octaprenylphenol hydroxylase